MIASSTTESAVKPITKKQILAFLNLEDIVTNNFDAISEELMKAIEKEDDQINTFRWGCSDLEDGDKDLCYNSEIIKEVESKVSYVTGTHPYQTIVEIIECLREEYDEDGFFKFPETSSVGDILKVCASHLMQQAAKEQLEVIAVNIRAFIADWLDPDCDEPRSSFDNAEDLSMTVLSYWEYLMGRE